MAVEVGPELQAVPPTRGGKRVINLVIVLSCILRARDRIADIRISADNQIRRACHRRKRGLVSEAETAGGGVVLRGFEQRGIPKKRDSRRLHGLRRKQMYP